VQNRKGNFFSIGIDSRFVSQFVLQMFFFWRKNKLLRCMIFVLWNLLEFCTYDDFGNAKFLVRLVIVVLIKCSVKSYAECSSYSQKLRRFAFWQVNSSFTKSHQPSNVNCSIYFISFQLKFTCFLAVCYLNFQKSLNLICT
jgi:hypothetical protein